VKILTSSEKKSSITDKNKELILKYNPRRIELEKQLATIDLEKKKKNGVFFTPLNVATWLFSSFLMPWIKKQVEKSKKEEKSPLETVKRLTELILLEPGFGKASFLCAAFTNLIDYYNWLSSEFFPLEVDFNEINPILDLFLKDRALFILKFNLRGIERDPLLYELGLIELSIYTGIDILNSPELRSNYKNNDFFDNIAFHNDARSLKDKEHEEELLFDLIYGNPPWGASISPEFQDMVEKLDKNIKKTTGTKGKESRGDSFIYFSARSLALLKLGGRLGFLVPNFLLTNPSYTGFRKFLLKYKVKNVVNLQENLFNNVTMPSCFFSADKVSSRGKDILNVFKQIGSSTAQELFSITYSKIYDSSLYRIPLVKYDHQSFLGNHKLRMRNLLKNGRGIEIGKKGSVTECPACGSYRPRPRKEGYCVCPNCRKEFDSELNQKNIINEANLVSKEGLKHEIIIGAQVQKFRLLNPDRYVIETGVKGINYKQHLMRAPKILIRKTGSGINATIDRKGYYTVQVVYILFFPDFQQYHKGFSLDYICALLNSSMMSELYFTCFTDPDKSRFPHLIQRNLLELPVPEAPVSLIKQIEDTTVRIQHSKGKVHENSLEKIDWLVKEAFQY
jgi:hypothetical protein